MVVHTNTKMHHVSHHYEKGGTIFSTTTIFFFNIWLNQKEKRTGIYLQEVRKIKLEPQNHAH